MGLFSIFHNLGAWDTYRWLKCKHGIVFNVQQSFIKALLAWDTYRWLKCDHGIVFNFPQSFIEAFPLLGFTKSLFVFLIRKNIFGRQTVSETDRVGDNTKCEHKNVYKVQAGPDTVEIPCPTCPTWSHFIQDKLKISIYVSLDKYKCIKLIQFCFSYFD